MTTRVFVTDWDETATVQDTTALVALAAGRTDGGSVPPFTHFSQIYLDAYAAYTASVAATCGQRDSMAAEEQFQKGMRAVELTSIGALEKSGFFAGIPKLRLADLVPRVELRPGFVEFVQMADCPVYVLSVNWCRCLIEAVLESRGLGHVTVLANDLEMDSQLVTTGRFSEKFDIRTGFDKVAQLARIRAAHPRLSLFYFGDSSGDVLPIVKADYGGMVAGGRARPVLASLATVYALQHGFRASDAKQINVFEATWPQLARAWRT